MLVEQEVSPWCLSNQQRQPRIKNAPWRIRDLLIPTVILVFSTHLSNHTNFEISPGSSKIHNHVLIPILLVTVVVDAVAVVVIVVEPLRRRGELLISV